MNETLFFLHICLIIGFVFLACKLGKESLIACFSVQIILSNLFITKQMLCFGLHVTCTDVYTIGALFSLNLLQEYFGKKCANQTIWATFFVLLFCTVMSKIHLNYHPSQYDSTDTAFKTILCNTPRIMTASFFVTLLTQKLDVELFAFLKRKFLKQALFWRFGGSALVTQFLDTLLFSIIALHGLVHNVGSIILMSYFIKILVILCLSLFTIWVKKLIPHEPI